MTSRLHRADGGDDDNDEMTQDRINTCTGPRRAAILWPPHSYITPTQVAFSSPSINIIFIGNQYFFEITYTCE